MRLKIVYFSSSFFYVVFIRASLDVLTEAETMLQQEYYDEAAEKPEAIVYLLQSYQWPQSFVIRVEGTLCMRAGVQIARYSSL